jgi:membrane protease YdiL (CAAX protease family)
MELRDWCKKNTLLTVFFQFLILSISVGILYLAFTDLFALDDILFSLGWNSISVSFLSYGIRATLASFALFLVIPLVFYQQPRDINGYNLELGVVKGISWMRSLLCGIISILLYLGIALGLSLSLGILSDEPFVFFQAPGEGKAGWLLLIAAINPGFFEEIGFRGVLFSTLEKKYSKWLVVLLSAVFFGLFHLGSLAIGEDPFNVIFLVLMSTTFGLSWGYMRLKTKSAIPSIIVHYLIDALSEGLLSPNVTDQAEFGIFIIGLIILYPLLSIASTKLIFLSGDKKSKRIRTMNSQIK